MILKNSQTVFFDREIRETGKHRIRQRNIFIYRAISETKKLMKQFIVTLLWKQTDTSNSLNLLFTLVVPLYSSRLL